MKKPEGYIENEYVENFFGRTSWTGYYTDKTWHTPQCVPFLHRGLRSHVDIIIHKMDYSCSCPKNFDKIVKCLITLDNGTMYYGTHLPGQCPGLKYRPRHGKKAPKKGVPNE